MISPAVRHHLDEVKRLCREHHVRRLDLFGSATGDQFDDTESDFDFVVEFSPMRPKERAKAYFGLLFALEELFERSVDLVEQDAIRNPYFQDAVDESRAPVYAAA